MARARSVWHWGIVAVYGTLMLYASVLGVTRPYCNWDMLGYVASVVSWQTHGDEAIYATTMQAVKENVPDWMFQQFAENPLSSEAHGFVEQLPIYQVKPLYNGLMWLLHQPGIPLPVASWIVSAASFGILAIILFLWRPRYMTESVWLLLVLALTFFWSESMSILPVLSTPDALCTLLTTAGLFGWLHLRSARAFYVLGILAMLARPDALLFLGLVAVYFAYLAPANYRLPRLYTAVFCAFMVIAYMLVSKLTGNYGLERWFIYAFIHKTAQIAEQTDHLTMERYWQVLYPSTLLFLGFARTMTMIGFSLLATGCYLLKPLPENRVWHHMLLLSWASLIIRFLMFPGWGEHRYYYVYYIIMLRAGGELIAPYASGVWRVLRAHHDEIRRMPA